MAEGTINVQDPEALAEESRGVLKDCEEMRNCIEELRKEKESLSSWESAEKDRAFASIDAMIAKLEDLLEMAESYGAVGVQSAAATVAAEEDVKNLNNKFADYVA
jgi:hypothetical protein